MKKIKTTTKTNFSSKKFVQSCRYITCTKNKTKTTLFHTVLKFHFLSRNHRKNSFWFHLVPFGSLWFLSVPFVSLWFLLVPFGPFWSLLVPFVPFGPFWFLMVPYGSLWFLMLKMSKLENSMRHFKKFSNNVKNEFFLDKMWIFGTVC